MWGRGSVWWVACFQDKSLTCFCINLRKFMQVPACHLKISLVLLLTIIQWQSPWRRQYAHQLLRILIMTMSSHLPLSVRHFLAKTSPLSTVPLRKLPHAPGYAVPTTPKTSAKLATIVSFLVESTANPLYITFHSKASNTEHCGTSTFDVLSGALLRLFSGNPLREVALYSIR